MALSHEEKPTWRKMVTNAKHFIFRHLIKANNIWQERLNSPDTTGCCRADVAVTELWAPRLQTSKWEAGDPCPGAWIHQSTDSEEQSACLNFRLSKIRSWFGLNYEKCLNTHISFYQEKTGSRLLFLHVQWISNCLYRAKQKKNIKEIHPKTWYNPGGNSTRRQESLA